MTSTAPSFLRSVYGVTCLALLVIAAFATLKDPRGVAVFAVVMVPIAMIRLLWTIRTDLRRLVSRLEREETVPVEHDWPTPAPSARAATNPAPVLERAGS